MKTELHTDGKKTTVKLTPETAFEIALFDSMDIHTMKNKVEKEEKNNVLNVTFSDKKLAFLF
jgi:hypothetical protein